MRDQKKSLQRRVKELVQKGITSPSIILSSIPEIKSWRTARKYIQDSIDDLYIPEHQETLKMLIYTNTKLRDDLLLKIENTPHINQYIGGIKAIISLNDQVMRISSIISPQQAHANTFLDVIQNARRNLENAEE